MTIETKPTGDYRSQLVLAAGATTAKLAAFTTMTLARCPRCSQGDLSSHVTRHHGGSNFTVEPLGGVALSSATVKQLFD